MTQVTREEHFQKINNYRHFKEYQESPCCCERVSGDLPSLLNNPWEISEEIYWEFLECLPPMSYNGNSFYICEFSFDDITTHFFVREGKYFCEFSRYPVRKAA